MSGANRFLALALIAVSAILLFWRLDAVPLWRDEGTTAVWARLAAESGSWAPWVYDSDREQLLVQAADGHDVNSKLLPAMQSYGQFYVVAASFKLFGATTWSARAPLAIAGALTLWVLYRLGVTLFGLTAMALVPPALAISSLFFLNAARQSRYYMLAALAAALILLEVARYVMDREVIRSRAYWLRLAAWGLAVYFSNYVGFIGTWSALGVWVLLERDLLLIKRFLVISAAMAMIVVADFSWLHAEFAGAWPPADPKPIWQIYQGALANRGRDLWRIVPLVLLLPAGIFLYAQRESFSRAQKVWGAVAAAAALAPLALFGSVDARAWSTAQFWAVAALYLSIPVAAWLFWRGCRQRGPLERLVLLAGLMLFLGPLITIAAGQAKALTRHYYQILPATVVVCAGAVEGMRRAKGRGPAAALLVGLAAWPNLDHMMGGTEQIVQRQYAADSSYLQPLLDYLEGRLEPGDRVAFARNVKGMPVYFYFPHMRWVGLLDPDAPHNAQFRGRIPDDQFKTDADPDWWVVWDQRQEQAPGLNDVDYERVWEHSYSTRLSWWDRNSSPRKRTYQVWRRRP